MPNRATRPAERNPPARRSVARRPDTSAPSFADRVLAAVRAIPPGRVATYGDVAAMAGRPRAARAVGHIMRACLDRRTPCHRVIAAGGRLGGYGSAGLAFKAHLLELEGCRVRGGRVQDFVNRRWPRPARVGGRTPVP
jgi:methylated-DNA-[protein]-cysteine S-methyltransferase